jgi:hypothetical protein
MKKFYSFVLALAGSTVPFLATPLLARAQQVGSSAALNEWGFTSVFKISNLPSAVRSIVNILLVAAGMIAVIYLIIGGYQYVTAGGNSDSAANARTTILNALIGLVIIFSAFAVVNFVVARFLNQSY